MASFSIEEILGLGKDNNSSNSNSEDSGVSAAAAKNSEQEANNLKPRAAGTQPEADHEDIDVETVDEENAAEHEPVTVEAEVHSTSPPASSIIRGGRASRKRKRSQQAEESSDGDHPECSESSSSSPGQTESSSTDQNSEKQSSPSKSTPTKPAAKRMRTAFTTTQLRSLEYSFRVCPYPDSYGREQIASVTGINESKIQVWFQNRRARYRKREKPLEAQRASGSAGPSSATFSHAHHSAMMQAYFTAAALQQGAARFPITPSTPLGPLAQLPQFYTTPVTNPFIATMPPAAAAVASASPLSYPPPPGLFTYPAPSPMSLELMAAAAQMQAANAAKQAQDQKSHDEKNQSPPK